MLTKNEDKIMFAVYSACKEKSCALLSPDDILTMAGVRGVVSYDALDKILEALEYDDYFDLILSDRRGEKVYCITLHEKGQGYKRQKTIVQTRHRRGRRVGQLCHRFDFEGDFYVSLLFKANICLT